ncbi:hypothetical protein SEA_DATBOI_103 [Gordonia phage DatBoi]|nr:hypothetical protein SEA_DATBOI_103 [Gordonia phage DatBoi]
MSTMHVGRSFTGHLLEDLCPCPQQPCGLVATNMIHPDCDQHTFESAKTLRQAHNEELCHG